MKSNQAAASSSSKSTNSSSTTMEDRDSCYYPGCKKDANCNCEICLASINATLDLIQNSSLTKLSVSRPKIASTPVSFRPSILSTPSSNSFTDLDSPPLKSTARVNFREKNEEAKKPKKKRGSECGFGWFFLRLVSGLSLFFVVETGVLPEISRVLKPALSDDLVRKIGERSWVVQDLSGKLRFLQNEFNGIVDDKKFSDCSNKDSIWKINQDGLPLNSQCVLYKSATEEVRIWGWPLQTAGMIKTGLSSRSFTVLSGRLTEWSDGVTGYSVRNTNNSWVHKKLGSSVVQLDPSTWVLEYSRSSILDCPSLASSVAELIKWWSSRVITRIKQEFWWFSIVEDRYSNFRAQDHIMIPT
ncbi:uncharacterized protein LOC126670194 [Mercurialis annua]|uniref:uncharacterized protein LOC126670194 n=1 Tax=Mercurialis annua TaxID=3986 RepID=UPI0021600083|nr:uncharacterized protein LOC126670194 [Mercurialis annua]